MTAEAAPIAFNSLRTGCVSTLNSEIHGNRFVARKSLTITAININIGSGSSSNFSTSKYYIMSDNLSTNNPSTVLETFTADAVSGSGVNTLARFIGSYNISAGTKFWVIAAQTHAILPLCFAGGGTTSNITMDGITLDTSTSLSNSSFRRGFNNTSSSPINASWGASFDDGYVFQLTIEASDLLPSPAVISIALTSGGKVATFKASTSLKATVNVSSKITFFANSKVIPQCRNIPSSGGFAYCNWKPSQHGSQQIYARAVPTDGLTPTAASSPISVGVALRTNPR
jgi:hypothetical protein